MTETFSSFLEELAQNSFYSGELATNQQAQVPPNRTDREGIPSEGVPQHNATSKRRDNAQTNGGKRNKYIPRACQDCQRRKVKCSGENVCSHCRNRKMPCVYSSKADGEPNRKRLRASSPSQTAAQRQRFDPISEVPSPSEDGGGQSVEDRIARLQDRIKRAAEEGNARGKEGGQTTRMRFTSTNVNTFDTSIINIEDTDTFDNGAGENNLSLSAQLLDLQKILKHRAGITSRQPQSFHQSRVFPLELPHPTELQRLLGICFREIGSFFPFLDQSDTETRIVRVLEELGYSDYSLIVDVDTRHHALVALLCNMLVLGESYDAESKRYAGNRPGWATYQRGKRLIQQCGSSRIFDIDLVRYHTLGCLYMMNSELLQPAWHALSTSVQIAMMLKLNDQSKWEHLPEPEKLSRRRLWWTIYYLDRRISQRNGAPYIIHDQDVAVDDFQSESIPAKQGTKAAQRNSQTGSSTACQGLGALDSDKYLQSLVDFSRLWGYIWDTFYAALATKGQDWKEIVMTDTRIYIFRSQLPADLTWDTDKVNSYLDNGEEEPQVRRRLALFIRINLLRMIIRQNPTLSRDGDEEARLFCARLAQGSVNAIEAFSNAFSSIQASGYFISTALVECIYHVMYILQDQAALQVVDRRGLLNTFLKAYQLLTDFAVSWSTARRAVQALSRAIFSGGDASVLFDSISKPQSEHGDIDQGGLGGSSMNNFQGIGCLSSAVDFGSAIFEAPSLTDLSNEILNGDCGVFGAGMGGVEGAEPVDLDYAHLFSTS